MTIKEYVAKLRQAKLDIDAEITKAARDTTIRAVEVTSEATPENKLRGANTASGSLRAAWAKDSVVDPVKTGNGYQTILWNKMEYASYVENGHRMDRHFVPGLIINPSSGMLEYNPNGEGGIVVGTKTSYVPGVYMSEKGVEEYEKAIKEILEQRIKEVLE